jgi:nucleoid-associated protein YgaU
MAMSKRAIAGTTCALLTADLILIDAFRQRFVVLVQICRFPRRAFADSGADTVVADVAAGALWILGVWTAAALALGLVATTPGRAGATARTLLTSLTPKVLLRLVALATGAGVLGAPAMAAAAPIGTPSPATPISSTARPLPAPTLPLTGTARSTPPPTPSAVPARSTEPAPPAGRSSDLRVVVAPGDSLWRIAERAEGPAQSPNRTAAEVGRWYAANRSVIGPDPDLIHPGLRLRPPTDPEQS